MATIEPLISQNAARHDAAVALRGARSALSRRLAAIVSDWEKYADRYAADPERFAEEEKGAFVDYLATYLDTGDATYRQLMIGERIKQFFRPELDPAAHRRLIAEVQTADRTAIVDELAVLRTDALAAIASALDEVDQVLLADTDRSVRVLFVGDCLYLDVVGFLAPALAEWGIALQPFFIASKDSADQRAQIAKLSDRTFDVVFYSPLTYEFTPAWARLMHPRSAAWSSAKLHAQAKEAIAPVEATLDLLAQLFESSIFIHNAGGIYRHQARASDRIRLAATRRVRRTALPIVNAAIEAMVAKANARSIRHVFVFDERRIVDSLGIWEAGRAFYTADLQHPAVFGREVAAAYAHILYVHGALMKRKLVVCDLDNTLWDGVIGEGNGVSHHRDRQAILRRLKDKGIVLAINSKNDRRKVIWGDGALLGHEDFVSSQINWDPKVLNMRRIAEHLNLKPKDFVFIDDRSDERALVGEAFPGLLTLDALDARSWEALDQWASWLPESDSDRTSFYRQRDQRREFLDSEVADAEAESAAALAQLGLATTIREAGEGDLVRVAELINRTNQFNTAGSRVTRAEIAAAHADPNSRVLIASAADRFGDMGIVCVLVAELRAETMEIIHFVLSCRVFGYAIEVAMLNAVRHLGSGVISGQLVQTPFNEPCRAVFADNCFSDEGERWTLEAETPPRHAPAWLMVNEEIRPF
ncbi:HAD-IIIC family phosphatase [Sphingomonas bacterium]|uniref:HAD-IIIC family phosphatase n=1 Tax=Sphingomonas bacterium TaxID=1895847 RepID=UPI0015774D9C|nr:HAD-IIIC family phosphatase [Sphingomonas bacterium]